MRLRRTPLGRESMQVVDVQQAGMLWLGVRDDFRNWLSTSRMPEHPYLQWPVFRRSVVAAFHRFANTLAAAPTDLDAGGPIHARDPRIWRDGLAFTLIQYPSRCDRLAPADRSPLAISK
jgi:hypothetical protein